MAIDRRAVRRILIITLSNIGDIVLTLPVLGVLRREFPGTEIAVLTGPNGRELFEPDPSVSKVLIYDKHMNLFKKIEFGLRMRRRNFDLVVDLRHSLFPLLIGARYNSPVFTMKKNPYIHKRDKHLSNLADLGIAVEDAPFSIYVGRDDRLHLHSVLNELGLLPEDGMVAVAAGAKSHTKRWTTTGFIKVCDRLNKEAGLKVLLIGDDSDRQINEEIAAVGLNEVYNLTGKTNLRELAYLFSLCKLLITNDSAPLHIAGSCGLPAVAIFGPTDEKKYGPLSPNSVVIRERLKCAPCQKAQCRFGTLQCLTDISADEVFNAAKDILAKI